MIVSNNIYPLSSSKSSQGYACSIHLHFDFFYHLAFDQMGLFYVHDPDSFFTCLSRNSCIWFFRIAPFIIEYSNCAESGSDHWAHSFIMTTLSPLSLTSRDELSNSETRLMIIKSLDAWSSKMAKDLDTRFVIMKPTLSYGWYNYILSINIEKNLSSELWGPLEMMWKAITESCMDQDHPTQDDLDLLSSVTKFTRNLVAGVGKHQVEA